MITSLAIKNYTLIEKLSIDFSSGFTIITGETGAGKSIILGAIGLVLGKRADLTSLKNKDEKCVIEAHFNISKYNLKAFFEANNLDYEDETIIRREILPTGKSRAFINDSPVNLQELQDLSLLLIDIHSQQQTQELSNDSVQFSIIDAIADNQILIEEYQTTLKEYKKEEASLDSQIKKQNELVKTKEYNAFLLDELVSAQLKSGELEQLEAEFEKLNNVEAIKEAVARCLSVANDEEIGTLSNLKGIKNELQKISPFSSEYESLATRVTSLVIELDDISDTLAGYLEKLVSDPERLNVISQKIQLCYTLQKKHQVNSIEELLEIKLKLESTLFELDGLENEISSLQQSIKEKTNRLDNLAEAIHQKRKEAVLALSQKLMRILALLGMPDTRFNIEINTAANYLPNGKDEIQFLVATNKGSEFGLLKKVVSGGEMARIMLAVKSILANYLKLPTLIFDEIDTGVSGEIAIKMGEIMEEMSHNMQIFAITHLPQIAARGNSHFKVFKSTLNDDTQSELKLLTKEERIIEIAQMLSGTVVSDSAINHAKSLLE